MLQPRSRPVWQRSGSITSPDYRGGGLIPRPEWCGSADDAPRRQEAGRPGPRTPSGTHSFDMGDMGLTDGLEPGTVDSVFEDLLPRADGVYAA